MSIELPEALILARQMDEELRGKRVESCDLKDYERLQRIGFLNEDISEFEQLVGRKIESVVSSGNVVLVRLDKRMNLMIGPEYGGRVLYHASGDDVPEKYHLRVGFNDGTALTVRLTSMGVIKAVDKEELVRSYMYRRDFAGAPSLMDDELTPERFSVLLAGKNRMLKSLLVGKDALVVGLSNSAFQDIAYRAGLHPKRKGSDLSGEERRALYDAVRTVLRERLRLGGKDRFVDIHGNPGGYTPAMGPNMKQQACPECGTSIEEMSVGGGKVYFCPKCQR
jgi:formamidopyrimidine-DNA glycosylase